jgi:hypothetical protein
VCYGQMFDVIISCGIGLLLVILFFFFTATSPSQNPVTPLSRKKGSSSAAGVSAASAGAPSETCSSWARQRRGGGPAEGVRWLGVVLQFAAWTALGRGGGDPAVWNSVLAHKLSSALEGAMTAARRKLGSSTTPRLHLAQLSCGTYQEGHTPQVVPGGGLHLRSSGSAFTTSAAAAQPPPPLSIAATSPAVLTSHCGGIVLPTIGPIASREYLCGHTGRTVREFRAPVMYTDNGFTLRLTGELPLFFGFGAPGSSLRIPADFVTAKTSFVVSKIDFSADAVFVASHSACEMFFDAPPSFSASIQASAGGKTAVLRDPKVGELVHNAIRLGLDSLVFPKCLRMSVCGERPFVRWTCGTCDDRKPTL